MTCTRCSVRPAPTILFPKGPDRARWTGIAREKREQLLAWGNEALAGYPMLTTTRFLAFSRTGNRQVYEQPYFARRSLLMGAALAECAADDGRYLDAVIDGIWCICEESAWCSAPITAAIIRARLP